MSRERASTVCRVDEPSSPVASVWPRAVAAARQHTSNASARAMSVWARWDGGGGRGCTGFTEHAGANRRGDARGHAPGDIALHRYA